MAEVKWIKITTEIFDDEKILMIEGLPSADSIIVIWFKLLIFAGKQNNDGVFIMNNRIAYTDEMLASIFRRDINTVRMALETFQKLGMIDIIDNVITIPNWNKHQTLDSYEKKKERDRLYMRERRAAQRALIEKSSDKSSDSNTTRSSYVVISEEEKEKEEDKERDNTKENKKKKSDFDSVLSEIADDDLKNAYLDFIEMRKTIKSPMTERALRSLIKKVNELEPDSVGRQRMLLDNAILNNWKSVYPLKDQAAGQQQQPKAQPQTGTDEWLNQLKAMYKPNGG